MAGKDRDPKGVPEAAPSARVLADQVEDVLAAIRAEIGDEEEEEEEEEEALDPDHGARLSRPSIPDFLAAAIVVAEPSSPVDAWARGDEARDSDDYTELVVDGQSEPPRLDPIDRDTIDRGPIELLDPRAIDLIANDPTELDDGPATLRPSAVSLPAYAPPRRSASRWFVGATAVAATAGILVYTLAPTRSAAIATTGLSEELAVPAPKAPTTGRLALEVATEGARIFVDGEPRDASAPIDLAPGSHAVRVEAPGYEPHERSVTIEAGATAVLGEVALEAKRHAVIIEVEPKSAYVMITRSGELGGRRYAAPWPRTIEVEPGHYTVVAFRNGLETVLRPLEVRPGGDPVAVRIRLAPEDIYR